MQLASTKGDFMPNQNDALYIRCSDGRTKRPDNILDKCTHQVRVPGGILDPQYMNMTCDVNISLQDHEELLKHRIRTMVTLKNPKKIIFASHTHCGAGQALGLDEAEIMQEHQKWGTWAREEFPDTEVEVVHENHSECGAHREWVEVDRAAA